MTTLAMNQLSKLDLDIKDVISRGATLLTDLDDTCRLLDNKYDDCH